MKKLGFFIIMLGLATMNFGFAGIEKIEDTAFHSLGKQIQNHVKYPSFTSQMGVEESSTVKFRIEDDFTISVVSVSGRNAWINQYVKGQLQKKKVRVPEDGLGKIYKVTINFYLI